MVAGANVNTSDTGAFVQQAEAPPKFRLTATANRLAQQEKGTVTSLWMAVGGTSVADMKWHEYGSDLIRLCGGFAGSVLKAGGSNSNSPRNTPGLTFTDTGTITQSNADGGGNDPSVWHGPTFTMGAGSSRAYGMGGVNATYDHAEFLYIGGTGVFSVQVGTAAAVNVDTSQVAAGTLGIYTATVAARAQQAFKVTQVSGTPKIIGPALWDSTIAGLVVMDWGAPGLQYSLLTSQAYSNLTSYFAHYKPDLLTWEAKAGQWTPNGTDTANLTALLNALQNAVPDADVILIGSTPDSGGAVPGGGSGVDQHQANVTAAKLAATYLPTFNVVSWDGYTPMGSWSDVLNLDALGVATGGIAGDWKGDGIIHLGWKTQAYLADLLLKDMGLTYLERNITARQQLLAGSKLVLAADPSNPNLQIENDNFNLDAFMYLKRWLRFRAAGTSTDFFVIDPIDGTGFISELGFGATETNKVSGDANGITVTQWNSTDPLAVFARTYAVARQQVNVTANTTLNLTGGNFIELILGGNFTVTFPTGTLAGEEIELHVKQDAAGGRTLALSGVVLAGGTYTPSTAANARDVLHFRYDNIAGVWRESAGRAVNLPS